MSRGEFIGWHEFLFDGSIKIKEEPLDHDENNDEHSLPDATIDKPETTFATKIENHTETKVKLSNNIVTSNINITIAGSLTTCPNSNENHLDNSNIIRINNIKSYNNQNQIKIGNDLKDMRLRTRTRSNIAECDICYVRFSDQAALRVHKSRYNKVNLVCHICKLSFITPIHLTSHRRSSHRGVDWRCYIYECHYCKLGFRKKHVLQQHIFHCHNINEFFINKRSRRSKNRSIKHTRTSLNSKSRNLQRNKRKCISPIITTDSPKKLAMSLKSNEINLQCKENNNQFNNDKHTNDVAVLQQSSSISNSQNDINKSLNSSTLLFNPPLVKICAVPNEVETLLNDCDDTDDSLSDISNSSDDSNFSSMTDVCIDDYLPKKYSLRSRTSNNFSYDEIPNRSMQRKWAILRKRFDCRDCRVELKKLSLPLLNNYELSNKQMDYTNTKNNETIQINSRPTVGMELKNLDLALKKLQDAHHKQDEILNNNDSYNLSGDSQELSESINIENSSSSIDDVITNKVVYMSSLCQTRFTTKKKLIFHYLCFHTNPRYQDCAVCRSQYTNISELTDHLSDHCIEIPESLNEKSPLDPKGPCENCKEKYTCKGCKMKFWLVSHLREHEQHCSLASQLRMNHSFNNIHINEEIVINKPSVSNNYTEIKQTDVAVDSETKPFEFIVDPSFKKYYSKPGEQLFTCKFCRSSFKTISNLEEHIRKFSLRGRRSNYCNRCGTPFPSPSLLSAHTRTAHLPESSTYKIHCSICQQGFNANRTLREHMMHIHREELEKHVDDEPKVIWNLEKTCSICKTIFSDRKRFIEHSMYYYDDEIIECSMCGEEFSGRYKAHAHTKIVHYSIEMRQSYTYCCNICLEGFVYPSHLYSHMYHVHNTDIQHEQSTHVNGNKHDNNQHGLFYMCRICHQTFDTPTLLTDHQMEYSNTGDFSCSKCQRKFLTNLLLERHVELSHSGQTHVNQIECHSCHEILYSKSSWLAHLKHFHINSNTDNRPPEMWPSNDFSSDKSMEHSYVTPLSVDNSTNANEINKNVDTVINEVSSLSNQMQIEYTCALCDMKFLNSSELKTHSLKYGNTCVSNTEMNNFSIASIYSVELEDYENLSDAKNDGNNKIKNNEENKIVEVKNTEENEKNNENNLDEMNKISDEKQLNNKVFCQQCHLDFSHRSSLSKHETLYSNEGDYKCNICQRKFKFIGDYQTHYRKHENRQRDTIDIPPYYCKTCDEKFVSERSKYAHFAHMHGIFLKLLPSSNVTRRSSPRQSKPQLQMSLYSFFSRNSKAEESKESNNSNPETHADIIRDKKVLNEELEMNINPKTISNPIVQQNSSENIHKNKSTIFDNSEGIRNLSVIPVVLPSNLFEEPTKIVGINKLVMKENEIVIVNGNENEIVDVENEFVEIEEINKDKEIIIDDEITELENESANKNTSELCDVCGDAFTNRQDLINHQKDSHNIEIIAESQNDIQCEFIDIESIIEDEHESENNNLPTDFDNDDINIIFDSTRTSNDVVDVNDNDNGKAVNKKSAIVHPIKPGKTYLRKTRLECKICHMKFVNLNKLGEHLEEQHQTDSPSEVDNIQNPRVSSSSHQEKSNIILNEDNSIQETLIKIDDVQHHLHDMKIINYTKDSTLPIGKNLDVIKKSNDGIILRKIILKQDLDTTQNSIISGPTRFPRLVPLPRNTLIIPFNRQLSQKINQQNNNDVPR
ncbi:hypothetical protein PV327_004164 [Microctonus hyperodae]|uniref:C2H2-type domain-containing protein n=1 Tax=Microctonus hyperodae TaxID=165561 RepID=A0AA39FBU3_MICHY|nr:hypothetical protein PV327_004164 [Microctonus hyperodae]